MLIIIPVTGRPEAALSYRGLMQQLPSIPTASETVISMDNPTLQPFVYTGSSNVLDLVAGRNNVYDKGDVEMVFPVTLSSTCEIFA